MNQGLADWDTVSGMVQQGDARLNILEEEIDVSVQMRYMFLLHILHSKPKKFKRLQKEYMEHIDDLFDDRVPRDEKEAMLAVLASVDDVAVYRAIEQVAKADSPLKAWATIALQQSRILIQSNLMEDHEVFISSGLGGKGNLLRYFCVFFNSQPRKMLEDFQQKIVRNETEAVLSPIKGEIEDMNFQPGCVTLTLLIPLDSDLKSIFTGIVEECNQYGNFLRENLIVTNVKKLSNEEIKQILHRRQR